MQGEVTVFQRYAIYYTPNDALADVGSAWLGWDLKQGRRVPHPVIERFDVAALTDTPRKYGLHATIKPPFAMVETAGEDALSDALAQLCAQIVPVELGLLELNQLRSFIALTPAGDQTELGQLAAQVVKGLDAFRAPLSPQDLARRRRSRLTGAQDQNLVAWGYPYVMDEFQFHITLTGRIKGDAEPVLAALAGILKEPLRKPFELDGLTLAGQDRSGMFHEIDRFALTGLVRG